jgi:hypothetical protein
LNEVQCVDKINGAREGELRSIWQDISLSA